ncbi:MAG: acyltransferase family protein [Lachnospiraceae bacterium]
MNSGLVKNNQRILWIDIAKLFGVLIVVLVHSGINLPVIGRYLGSLMIPVFFVLSGYTWRKKEESFRSFAVSKGKRLLLPYFVCNLILVAFYAVLTGHLEKTGIFGIFYSRYMLMKEDSSVNCGLMQSLNSPTWFLTCMFLVLCIYFLLDRRFEKKKRRIAAAVCMLAGILISCASPVLLPWSLENALIFLGFVEFGRFIKEEADVWLAQNQWIYGNFFMLFAVTGNINGSINVSIGNFGNSVILFLITGCLGSLLCMKAAELTEKYAGSAGGILAWFGRHTLPIMCWHLLVIEILKKLVSILS